MSKFDIERLREAVAWIEAEAKRKDGQWKQEVWMEGTPSDKTKRNPDSEVTYRVLEPDCGSAYCVAGHVVAREGDVFLAHPWDVANAVDGKVSVAYCVPRRGRKWRLIDDRAMELLGITEEEAGDLFAGENNLRDVKRIARQIAKNHGEVL